MDFYSLALFSFYFTSQEEKTDDQIVTDFDIKKILQDKSFTNRFKSIDNATEVFIEHEQDMQHKKFQRRMRNNSIMFKLAVIFLI